MKIARENKYIVFYGSDTARLFSNKKEAKSFAKESHGRAYMALVDANDKVQLEEIANYSQDL